MARNATNKQIETAIEWLRCFDSGHEKENGEDIAAVIAWLEKTMQDRTIRSAARQHGVPTAYLREQMAKRDAAMPQPHTATSAVER